MATNSIEESIGYENEEPALNIQEDAVVNKFRICVIGGTGVGKSSLIGNVFQIDDSKVGVCDFEAGQHNINKPWEDHVQNRALIIHDSRGFEAGESKSLSIVQDFLKERSLAPRLQDQVHCIWYCIALQGNRPVQEAERIFLRLFKKMKMSVPIVFVLTKFDTFQDTFRREVIKKHRPRTLGDNELKRECEEMVKENVEKMKKDLEFEAGQPINLQEVSTDEGYEHLIEALVDQTSWSVKGKWDHIWSCAQRIKSQDKVDRCIIATAPFLSKIVWQFHVPLSPFKGVVRDRFFHDVFDAYAEIWNLSNYNAIFEDGDVSKRFRKAVEEHYFAKDVGAAVDITPLTGVFYIENSIKRCSDLILIFEILFRKIKISWEENNKNNMVPFGEKDIQTTLKSFHEFRSRNRAHGAIHGHMKLYKSMILGKSTENLIEILQIGVEAGFQHLEYDEKTPPTQTDRRQQRAYLRKTQLEVVSNGLGELPNSEVPAELSQNPEVQV